ncbi:hypothetical protein [Sphingomonas xinjiangensis]|uniref:Uncharacterized protein n=1 Tax=Sphingomonas xinjiangensis TaxID=643568 RepID=A0A840YSX9_9SPHN|nr:hypothetical protein [Sphingomonas xinjiangensis]MBB5712811.1 hypothetical protein [Sphingomonas xinjiangensis]
MSFDVAFRHQQALDPSALITIGTTLHALSKAMEDCRNAGVDAENDPAVVMLARHFSSVCATRPDEIQLRASCMTRINDLRRSPVLATLAVRGVSYDEPAKALFHNEGLKAMRRLAKVMGLASGTYDVRSNKGGIAVSGEITLHAEQFYVRLSLGLCGMDKEVLFRTCRGRADFTGGRNHFAGVNDLLDPDRFASSLVHELQLDIALPDRAEPLFA